SPLIGAGVEGAHAAAGNEYVELPAADVKTDVDRLDNHGLAEQRGRARIGGGIVGFAGELQLEAAAADVTAGGGGVAVSQGIVDGKGNHVEALMRATAVIATARHIEIAQL